MSRYIFEAINEAGKTIKGGVDAQSLDHANELIAARGLASLAVREEGERRRTSSKWIRWMGQHAVHPEELILFTKQIATMLRAGIPVLRVFDILTTQTENPRLKKVCEDISADVRSGSNLYRAMRRHPDVFNKLYCHMVLAGETSGALPQILQRLIYVIHHEYKVKSDVRAVIQYPILVLFCLLVAFVVLIVMVIPRFASVYSRAEVVLPWPTRVCLLLSEVLREDWLFMLLGIGMVVIALVFARSTQRGRYVIDRAMLKIPLIGPLMIKSALSRFASIFSILQATGVGILDSIHMLSETIGNAAISRELMSVQIKLEEGHGIANPLMRARYFTPMFINMVAIGEEAGNLDEMLKEISLHYDAEVEYATRRLTTALGPLLIVLLAIMVGFFALAVYLPMWDMARVVLKSG